MRSFGKLDRFIIREVVPPATLGFLVYTFLLMMRPIFNLVEQVLVRGVPWLDAVRVLANTIPHVMVLTIPMSFLFGVLIGIGRMNADNEIVALQAGGISASRLLRPIVFLGMVLTGVNSWMYVLVIPESNRSLREMRIALFASAKNIGRIEPGVFYEEFPNLLLYVREVAERGGRWRGVLIFDTSDPEEQRLTLASRGRIVMTGEPDSPTAGGGGFDDAVDPTERWILLEDVVNHQFNRSDPESYRFSRSFQQVLRPTPTSLRGGVARYQLNMRERETAELVHFLRTGTFPGPTDDSNPRDPDKVALEGRLATIELNRRLAIPFACVVFALLAVPLGVGARSGGRGRGFIVSVVVILGYYVINNNGEIMAIEGRIPAWLGVWLANIVLAVFALFLISRMGRWLGERQKPEGALARLIRGWRTRRLARSSGRVDPNAEPMTRSYSVGLQRRRTNLGFPTILDRYVIRRLFAPLGLVLVSTSLLYVIIDLTDNIDDMAKNHAPFEVIIGYYVNLVPQLLMEIMPLALMIAVLILLTVLERQQELTAFKAGGISLFRVVVPILLVASVVAGSMWTLGESVVPASNREAKRHLDRIKGRQAARTYTSGGRQWLLSRDDSSFYSFLQFDDTDRAMVRFTQFSVNDSMELEFHLFAERVIYSNGAWMAQTGWYRRVLPDETVEFEMITRPQEIGVPEGPEYFAQERRVPAEMSVKELRSHIDELVESGHQPARLMVTWHQKFTRPLAAFLMVFLALPFGLNRGGRRVTTMQGIAIALVLGIVYYVSVAFFGKLGEAEVLPAAIGAWTPALLAGLFALNRMTTLRT
jgi:LPS export ABC transporter permease LptG/LPS export ABC transporter permease LptF